MAIAEWPAELPQTPLVDGYSDVPQDSVIRVNMTGLTKQRNRYTAVLRDVSESYLLEKDQMEIFEDFFRSTLKNGSLDFIKTEPKSGQQRVYRFSGVYSDEYNGVQYKVTLPLEILP